MADQKENPADSTPKGAPPGGTGRDTTSSTVTGQKLLQSANGDVSKPTTDQNQPQPQMSDADSRTLFVSEYLSAGRRRPESPTESSAKPTAESIAKSFAELDQHLTRSGAKKTEFDEVKKHFEALRKQGKLPDNMDGVKQLLDHVNKQGADNSLTGESADIMLRLVHGSLDGSITLVTPGNVQETVNKPTFNRENPTYEDGQNNCRACTASYIINETLSERAILGEFSKILDKMDAGQTSGKTIFVPVENGVPQISAMLFQVNHGATHNLSAGEVHSVKEQQAFQKANPSIPNYIQNGLNDAGLINVTLRGGPFVGGVNALKEPGFYVLEHMGGPVNSDGVNGHVTAAFVDQQGKVHRIDSQLPENRLKDWPITAAYKVTIGGEALEQKSKQRNATTAAAEQHTRVINPDGTVRDFQQTRDDGQLLSMTDVDGRSYFRNPAGKWQTLKDGASVDAPFKSVEYLGARDGTKFTYENYTVTEKPDGTAEITVPSRAIQSDGAALIHNGSETKTSDLVSKITRNTDGSLSVQFKDNSTRVVKSETPQGSATVVRNARQLETQLLSLDGNNKSGTVSSGTLDRVIMERISEEAKGSDRASAILKLLKPNSSSADIDRMSQISEAMSQVGMPTDPTSIASVDKIMSELKLSTQDIEKAKSVLEKAQELFKTQKTPINERQALEIAILQNTQDPARGKNYTESSAKARLKKVDEIREQTRQKDMPLSTALEVQRLKEQYPEDLTDSFTKYQARNSADKGNETRRAYRLVQNPQVLADAEATYAKLKGISADATLPDAAAINAVPALKNNPDLADQALQRAQIIEAEIFNSYDGRIKASKYGATDFLKMALMAKDREAESGKSLKGPQIEAEYARIVLQEKIAANAKEAAPKQPSADREGSGTTVEQPDRDATAVDTTTSPPKPETGQPAPDNYRIQAFQEKLAALDGLPPPDMHNEYLRTALREVSSKVGRADRASFANTQATVIESDSLKPGESKLTIKHNGKPIEVTSVENGGKLQFVTADGSKYAPEECQCEMQVGQGSTRDQIAREALVRSVQLKELYDGKVADPAYRQAEDQLVKTSFEHKREADPEVAGLNVADRVAKLGAFELTSGHEPVLLTNSGVKFGGKPEVTFEALVKDTLKAKREHLDRMEKSRGTAANPELEGQIKVLNDQIKDLDLLSQSVHRPETIAKLTETIKKHATTEEIERLRNEAKAGEAGYKAVTKAGTYALVAVFVLQMIIKEDGSTMGVNPGYAPTSSGRGTY